MPILDTPITTDDRSLKKVLGQKQPALLLLHEGSLDKPLQDALNKLAKQNNGALMVVRVDVKENPDTYAQYGRPALPALVTLTQAFFGRKVKSQAERVRPSDLRAHADHLLTDKPLPEAAPSASAEDKSSSKPKVVTDSNFREMVLRSKTPVLVDFWAPWCGPCRTVAPYVDKLASEYAGKLKVVKLNTDENQVMARRYGIQSIPTFIVFDGGQPVQRLSGANPVALRQIVERSVH